MLRDAAVACALQSPLRGHQLPTVRRLQDPEVLPSTDGNTESTRGADRGNVLGAPFDPGVPRTTGRAPAPRSGHPLGDMDESDGGGVSRRVVRVFSRGGFGKNARSPMRRSFGG